jgi:hypothetical protein
MRLKMPFQQHVHSYRISIIYFRLYAVQTTIYMLVYLGGKFFFLLYSLLNTGAQFRSRRSLVKGIKKQ